MMPLTNFTFSDLQSIVLYPRPWCLHKGSNIGQHLSVGLLIRMLNPTLNSFSSWSGMLGFVMAVREEPDYPYQLFTRLWAQIFLPKITNQLLLARNES